MIVRNRSAIVDTAYREIDSDKGHDAFLVEWDQLTAIITEALATDATVEADEEMAIAASA